jgi:acyl-CoA synthetase (AMP-forming)/AMP-acid ligase II
VTKRPLIEAYGLTETSPAACINPMTLKDYNSFIGLPIPSTDVEIKDDNGRTLPLGEIGEICIKGPQIMEGYWQRPEETAKVMTQDNFFRTGDLGFMNEQGFTKIVDRKKDMILVSGFNVYPNELEETINLKDYLTCLQRPILPEDEPLLKSFIEQVTKEDLYYRYFSEISEFTHDDLANMTQIDYDREMAFVAVKNSDTQPEIIGVTRAMADPDNQEAEFAVLVRSDMKGQTLGYQLMQKLLNYTRGHGIKKLTAITMPENRNMISLAKKLGFQIDVQFEDGVVNLTLHL